MSGKIVRSALPMKAIAIWVTIELGSSPLLFMLAKKGIDCKICPPMQRVSWKGVTYAI